MNHNRYYSNQSSTYQASGQSIILPYGSGTVTGVTALDTIYLGGLTVTNQEFGETTTEPGDVWAESPFDGLCGLAYPAIAVPSGMLPPFDQIMKQQLLPKNVFSFYLSSTDGDNSSALILGGDDPSYYTGTIQYVPFNLYQFLLGYWLITGDNIKVNGQVVQGCSSCGLVVDTGTSVLTGPPSEINPLLQAIGNVSADCSNRDSLPTISFTISGQDYPLEPAFYVLAAPDQNGNTVCQLGIQALDPGVPLWILGDPFIRKYYTVFDRDNNRVGFAVARSPSQN